ncbi:MAG: hypothetical protein HY902_04755, partial [Deltaproteobacteria bacterium]|nr:hypothetical protein [Deltaproteobacteria bacterium]
MSQPNKPMRPSILRLTLDGLSAIDSAFRTVPGLVFLATLVVLLVLAAVTLRDAYSDSELWRVSEAATQNTVSLAEARLQLALNQQSGSALAVTVRQVQRETPGITRLDLIDLNGVVRASSAEDASGTRLSASTQASVRHAAAYGTALGAVGASLLAARQVLVRPNPAQTATQPWLMLVAVDDRVAATVRAHMLQTVRFTTVTLLLAAIAVAYFIHTRLISPAQRLGRHMQALAGTKGASAIDIATIPTELRPIAEGFNLGVEGLRKARQQLDWLDRDRFERVERLATIGRLSAMTAHEIRNPLAGIANAVAVIVREVPMDAESKGILEEVQAQARRLSTTLTDLLRSTQPHEPQRMAVDSGRLVERTVAMMRPSFNRCGQSLEAVVDRRTPPVTVDEEWLVQVLVNLMVNANEAMVQGGTAQVRLAPSPERPGFARLEVEDTGVGMAPEVLARAGEPFFTTRE